MAKIIMKSWQEGMQKVASTKLQMNLLNKSLQESKNNIDLLLEGKEIIIEVDNMEVAKEFQNKASKIGIQCTVET